MMRNSINSYLSALVMVLALLLSANAFAATEQSPISIEGKDYILFSGFNAIEGSAGANNEVCGYETLVDGDLESFYFDVNNGGYVEFSSISPIVLKGYVFDTMDDPDANPLSWTLKAKANEEDDWNVVSSRSDDISSGTNFSFASDNQENKAYRYFRFEMVGKIVALREIRLYGHDGSYTHLTPQNVTCAQQGVLRECYYRNDGKYFADELGTSELSAEECVVPKLPHNEEHHEADADYIEYWHCSVCGKFFSDAEMTNEITEVQARKVTYIGSDGTYGKTSEAVTIVTESMTTWNAGWYVVSDNVTIDERITVKGEVHLILVDGKTLNASKGISVNESAHFNVHAQSTDEATMGELIATATNGGAAGIGGFNDHNAAGSITINGGKINAIGDYAAGIGSGINATVKPIVINGGIVFAKDKDGYGAGIGAGSPGGTDDIYLNGGVIFAQGIGRSHDGFYSMFDCGDINISDGIEKLVVTNKNDGLGLNSENIIFLRNGTAVDGVEKDAIFYDYADEEKREIRPFAKNHQIVIENNIKASIDVNTAYAYDGEIVTLTYGSAINPLSLRVNDGSYDLALTDIGNNKITFVMPGKNVNVTADAQETYSVILPKEMRIINETNAADGEGKYISGTKIQFETLFPYSVSNVNDGNNSLVATDGVYSVVVGSFDITITADFIRNQNIDLNEVPSDFIALDGDVFSGETNHTIHIVDGATVTLSDATINGGIVCDGSATIIVVGTNNVTGADAKAGIQVGGEGTTLSINGDGNLVARGAANAAGIGLSAASERGVNLIGGDLIVESGNITAIGALNSAGIGCGLSGTHSNISKMGNVTIKGGSVKAIGGKDADGIGIGYAYRGSSSEIGSVTIYDTAEFVDASSIIDGVVYKHIDGESETDVSANPDPFFHIDANGDRRFILPIAEVADVTYTGKEITPSLINIKEGTDYEYSYSNNKNVGTATVTVTFLGEYDWVKPVSKSFNITKATPTVEPPTSANPKFAGNCVELVNPGITDFGKILYSIKEDEGYSSDIPCADRAGNYTVYYKVEESDNWSSVEGSVDVSVMNEEFTVTFVDAEGETISSDKYPYGTSAEGVELPPENPKKADDEMYAYTFAGWSPEIQDVTGAKTYRPNYDITRIGFGPITIAKDSSSAIIDGMSRDPIDKTIKDCMIKGEVTLYRHFAAGKYSTLVLPFSTFTGAFSGVSFYSFRGVEKENGVWKTVVFGYVDKENEGNKRIEANTPYIVVADADMDDLVVKDGVLFNADDPKSSYGATLTCSEETCDEVPDENKSWQFVGTYNYRQWDSGNNVEEIGTTYGFAGAAGNGGMEIGKFGKIKEGAYIYPMRAYLRYQPPSPPRVLFKAAPAYAPVASINELPESLDVVIRDEEGTTVIGTINTRTGEFRSADNRWFDLNGRYLGNKKPTIKGTYYNNGKKVIVK